MVLKRHKFATLRCRNGVTLWFGGMTILQYYKIVMPRCFDFVMSALVRLVGQESVNVPAAVEHPADLHSVWRNPVSDHNPTLERNKPQAGAGVVAKPSGFGELGQPIAPLDDLWDGPPLLLRRATLLA